MLELKVAYNGFSEGLPPRPTLLSFNMMAALGAYRPSMTLEPLYLLYQPMETAGKSQDQHHVFVLLAGTSKGPLHTEAPYVRHLSIYASHLKLPSRVTTQKRFLVGSM